MVNRKQTVPGDDFGRKGEWSQPLWIFCQQESGNSVVRHRITRLLRESVRTNDAKLKKSYNVVIVARNTAKGRSFQEIESAFLHLCRLHGIM